MWELPTGKVKQKRRLFRPGSRGPVATGIAMGTLALLAGFISLPLLSLVIWTVDKRAWHAMASPAAIDALLLSARTTSVSLMIIILVGTPAAYVLARADFPGKRFLDTLVDIPIVLPPTAAGIALLLTFGRMGLIGQYLEVFGVTISFTTAAVVLAEIFVAIPFYVRQAVVGFGQVSTETEEAAMVDGADRITVFTRVTTPLAFPALVSGSVTAWARAVGEFGATIIFAGSFQGTTQTMPLAIYASFESNFDASVALSVLVLGFSFAVILTARYLTWKAAEYRS